MTKENWINDFEKRRKKKGVSWYAINKSRGVAVGTRYTNPRMETMLELDVILKQIIVKPKK